MTRGTWSSLVLAVAASVALVGCGGGDEKPVDPIEIVTPTGDTGDPISLDIPLDDSGAFAFDQWPSACDLVSKETLQAIFPQTEGVQQSPAARQVRVLSIVPGENSPSGLQTIPAADCATKIGFTQEGLGLGDNAVVAVVNTSVLAAGSPKFVERNTQKTSGDDVKVGDTTCTFADGDRTYQCNVGKVAFKITIDMRQYAQYVRGKSSDYVVDGEAVSFQGADPEFDKIVKDKVLTPLVAAAVDRLG